MFSVKVSCYAEDWHLMNKKGIEVTQTKHQRDQITTIRKLSTSFIGERSEAYSRTRTRQNEFVFSRPLHLSAFHLFKSNFSGIYWWDSSDFYKLYDGFTIYQIPNFRQPNYFRRVSSYQKFFWFFQSAKATFLNPVPTVSFDVFALIDETPFSWAVCCNIFANFFSASFSQENSGKFWILSK